MKLNKILLVDDEVNVLNSIERTLNEEGFNAIKTAQNSLDALEIIANTPDLALIICDYRMPGMNGIELLAQVRQNNPDITRLLLTGAADLDLALEAINQGNVFRFMLKPCPSEILFSAIKDGLRQNELITADRELLKKTLLGCIKVMVDILSVVSPEIFAQANRLRSLSHDLAIELHFKDQSWEIELAALLSQIGAVTIPPSIIQRWQSGKLLEESDLTMIRSIPRIGKFLINNVPRLETIAEAVGSQDWTYGGQAPFDLPTAENIPLIARILKVIIDYDREVEKTSNPEIALTNMLIHEGDYDPGILAALRLVVLRNSNQSISKAVGTIKGEKEILIENVKVGMLLSRNVLDKHGTLIFSKGPIDSEVFIQKLTNYVRSREILEPIFIESEA